jgi:AraC-like DNA-binding protein
MAFSYSDGGATPVPVGHSTGWRTMPWLLTTYMGGGRARLELDGAKTVEYGDGDACCVPPGMRHRISVIEGGVSWWSHVSLRVGGGLDLTEFIEPPLVLRGERAERIRSMNGAMADARRDSGVRMDALFRLNGLLFELASVLAAGAAIRPERAALLEAGGRLRPVLQHIEAHLAEDLTRERLADVASLSPSRFYAVFQRALGVGSNLYVQRRRMERAQQLLITTALPVGEVGRACGYDDQFLFSRTFKKLHGASPAQYRRQVTAEYG